MSSTVLKTLKRSKAAEYSRELSVKVFSGQCRLVHMSLRIDAADDDWGVAVSTRVKEDADRSASREWCTRI